METTRTLVIKDFGKRIVKKLDAAGLRIIEVRGYGKYVLENGREIGFGQLLALVA